MKLPLFAAIAMLLSALRTEASPVGQTLPCMDREPAGTVGQSDSLKNPAAVDSVWLEATAKDALNFRVFGRYARDDARFEELKRRFEAADTTLLPSDLYTLYYGSAYRSDYTGGYDASIGRKEMEEDPQGGYDLCREKLQLYPTSLRLLASLYMLARTLGHDEEELDRIWWRYMAILQAISFTGDGSKEYPYVVIQVSDEYEVVYNLLDVKSVAGQELRWQEKVPFDVLQVVPETDAGFQGREVWFDIYYPLGTLMETMDGTKLKRIRNR